MATPTENLVLKHTFEPTTELVLSAQEIGFRAWLAQFGAHRTSMEIRRMFDPVVPNKNAEKLLEQMQEKAEIGLFSGIVALRGSMEVGYAWAADDMSGGRGERFYKKHIKGRKPYAWLAQINVLPEFQRQGIGSSMLLEVLDPFDTHQRPTAYVFDENPDVLKWFSQRGFSPSERKPTKKYDYFGEEADPAMQRRLVAPGIGVVQDFIRRSGELPIYYVE